MGINWYCMKIHIRRLMATRNMKYCKRDIQSLSCQYRLSNLHRKQHIYCLKNFDMIHLGRKGNRYLRMSLERRHLCRRHSLSWRGQSKWNKKNRISDTKGLAVRRSIVLDCMLLCRKL